MIQATATPAAQDSPMYLFPEVAPTPGRKPRPTRAEVVNSILARPHWTPRVVAQLRRVCDKMMDLDRPEITDADEDAYYEAEQQLRDWDRIDAWGPRYRRAMNSRFPVRNRTTRLDAILKKAGRRYLERRESLRPLVKDRKGYQARLNAERKVFGPDPRLIRLGGRIDRLMLVRDGQLPQYMALKSFHERAMHESQVYFR